MKYYRAAQMAWTTNFVCAFCRNVITINPESFSNCNSSQNDHNKMILTIPSCLAVHQCPECSITTRLVSRESYFLHAIPLQCYPQVPGSDSFMLRMLVKVTSAQRDVNHMG